MGSFTRQPSAHRTGMDHIHSDPFACEPHGKQKQPRIWLTNVANIIIIVSLLTPRRDRRQLKLLGCKRFAVIAKAVLGISEDVAGMSCIICARCVLQFSTREWWFKEAQCLLSRSQPSYISIGFFSRILGNFREMLSGAPRLFALDEWKSRRDLN